jgi:zinc transport system substrate-binding protein
LGDGKQLDPHIWLHSDNGLFIAAAVRDRVLQIEPGLAQQVNENYRLLEQELGSARRRWQQQMQQLPQVSYAVYHDAIGYFEAEFSRQHNVVLVDDPEVQPGIRHLMNVRRSIGELRPVCLFTDITSRQNTIDTLFADHQVRQQQLDLLGDRLSETAGYRQLIDNLVNDFSNCVLGERL